MIGFWYVFFCTDYTILINHLSYGNLYKQLYHLIRSYCVGWGFCDRVWPVFLCTDYTILDKLFELRPFIETVIPHEKMLLCKLGLL